jgi:hypothetical protein
MCLAITTDTPMILPIAKKLQAILSHERTTLDQTILQPFQNLSVSDAMKLALQTMLDLSADPKLPLPTYIKCLLTLDEGMQEHLEQLTAKRLKVKLYNREIGLAIDVLVYPYYRRLFLDYSSVLSRVLNANQHITLEKEALVLLYCRALNAGFTMMMWRYFDDQAAPAEAWSVIFDLFKHAEKSSLLNERLLLYPQAKKPVDMAVLMVGGLMLSTLQKENYNTNEIHIVSRLLTDWVRQASFEKAYAQHKYQYFVNLNQDKGAERIRAFDRNADYRYWRSDYLALKIADHLAAIGANAVDKESDIRGYASMRTMTKLFKKLNQDWSPTGYKRQRRSVTREKEANRLLVSNGLAQICKQLMRFQRQASKQGSMPIYDIRANSFEQSHLAQTKNIITGLDEWVLLDKSEAGFGVDLGREPGAWVEAGKLVGFQHPIQLDAYVIAEIKHLKRQKNGNYRAGLQLISLHSISMQLTKLDQTQVELAKGFYVDYDESDEDMMKVSCVWIPPSVGQVQVKSSVILPIHEYQRNRQFKIEINGEEKTLILGVALEMETEWVRASVAAIH